MRLKKRENRGRCGKRNTRATDPRANAPASPAAGRPPTCTIPPEWSNPVWVPSQGGAGASEPSSPPLPTSQTASPSVCLVSWREARRQTSVSLHRGGLCSHTTHGREPTPGSRLWRYGMSASLAPLGSVGCALGTLGARGARAGTRPRVTQSAVRSLGGVWQCQLAKVPAVSVCVCVCRAVCERWGGGGEERGGGRSGGGCGVAVRVD